MPPIGLAHVATASFLASRAVPSGGFAVALAGGVALARAAQRLGLRSSFGASLAAMLQTIAIMGPARVTIPLTQAVIAPLAGRMEARGWGTAAQLAVTIAIRATQNAIGAAFSILVLVGLDAFVGTYDRLLSWLPILPEGRTGALIASLLALVAWSIGASVVQVAVYRRGLRRWPADVPADVPTVAHEPPPPRRPRPIGARFDPRAVALAAALAFAILLTGTWWPMLAAVAVWLGIAWALARGDSSVVRAGLALTAVLALGTLVAGIIGGIGLELTLRRTVRAALLVLVATWLGYAAGEEGLREVFRRGLRRLERLPAMRETAMVLEGLGSTAALAASGKRLLAQLKDIPIEPVPLADAVLDWVVGEDGRHPGEPPPPPAPPVLHARRRDVALVALAAACALALPVAA